MKKRTKVYIGADHAGFEVKEKLKKYFDKEKIEYEDMGGIGDKTDDYPEFAFKVGKKVANEEGARGVLVCGSGTGMAIAANKVKGVRAVAAYDTYSAKMSRKDNDSNVLCLRGRGGDYGKDLKLTKAWLDEDFSGEDRHQRRIRKIREFEEGR